MRPSSVQATANTPPTAVTDGSCCAPATVVGTTNSSLASASSARTSRPYTLHFGPHECQTTISVPSLRSATPGAP